VGKHFGCVMDIQMVGIHYVVNTWVENMDMMSIADDI
jgi:hypothetical protein